MSKTTNARAEQAFDKVKFLRKNPTFVVKADLMPELQVILPFSSRGRLIVAEILADTGKLMALEVYYRSELWFRATEGLKKGP